MRLSVGDCIQCTTSNGNEFRLMYIGRYNNKSICHVVKCPEGLEKTNKFVFRIYRRKNKETVSIYRKRSCWSCTTRSTSAYSIKAYEKIQRKERGTCKTKNGLSLGLTSHTVEQVLRC